MYTGGGTPGEEMMSCLRRSIDCGIDGGREEVTCSHITRQSPVVLRVCGTLPRNMPVALMPSSVA